MLFHPYTVKYMNVQLMLAAFLSISKQKNRNKENIEKYIIAQLYNYWEDTHVGSAFDIDQMRVQKKDIRASQAATTRHFES